MKINKRLVRCLFIIALVTTFDLVTKRLVFSYLENMAAIQGIVNPQIELLPFFNIVYVWNRGVSFGMFNSIENSQIILSLLQGSIALILIILLYRNKDKYVSYAFSIIIGGALGNVIDRIKNGAVADFLDFHIASYHWPAFNVADSAIFIGVMMLLYKEFFMTDQSNIKNDRK